MLTTYSKGEIDRLIKTLKEAPNNSWYTIPRTEYFKKDIKAEFIVYMFEACMKNETVLKEPTEQQKEVYKNIFTFFCNLFGESEVENDIKAVQWKVSLNKCLRHAFTMKRFNMWLLKLLFKEGVRVNIDNYIYLLDQSPSPAVVKFVEKHLVDELENTISAEEMKKRIETRNQSNKKEQQIESKVDNKLLDNKVEKPTQKEVNSKVLNNSNNNNESNPITDSKVSLNLRWSGGSFKINLKNAHTSILEDSNGKILLDIQLD
jgi:hypothetical protein